MKRKRNEDTTAGRDQEADCAAPSWCRCARCWRYQTRLLLTLRSALGDMPIDLVCAIREWLDPLPEQRYFLLHRHDEASIDYCWVLDVPNNRSLAAQSTALSGFRNFGLLATQPEISKISRVLHDGRDATHMVITFELDNALADDDELGLEVCLEQNGYLVAFSDDPFAINCLVATKPRT